jgi:hypothetical protein
MERHSFLSRYQELLSSPEVSGIALADIPALPYITRRALTVLLRNESMDARELAEALHLSVSEALQVGIALATKGYVSMLSLAGDSDPLFRIRLARRNGPRGA